MIKRIPNALLAQLSKLVSDQMGLHFPKGRWLDLLRGIRSASQEFGFSDVEKCIHWLLSKQLKKRQIEILALHLTVGETYFLREPKLFDALEKHIIPNLIKERRKTNKRIRIWSAACCTGEEPYSIAIELMRLLPDINDWNITILATDINTHFLKRASEGVYRQWSFRGTPYWLQENYFKKTEEGFFEILPKIKRMVKFQYLNLVEDSYPELMNDTNAMDLIFCRNVLMYFTPDQVNRVIDRLYRSILETGWLIVSSSETSHILYKQFVTVNFPGAICYQKDSQIKEQEEKIKEYVPQVIPELTKNESTLDSFKRIFDTDKKYEVKDTKNPVVQNVKLKEEKVNQKTELIEYHDALEFFKLGHYEQTIEKALEVLSIQKENADAMMLLAKAYANQGKLNDALIWSEKAIKINKLNPEFHHLNAVILQEQGLIEEAMKSLKKTIYLEPNFILAHFMLGNLFRQQGSNKESNKYFENALTLLNNHETEQILPESEGMTAGRLREFIVAMTQKEYNA
jgi:chemotaxis protein methyltransferase CheR